MKEKIYNEEIFKIILIMKTHHPKQKTYLKQIKI